MAERVAVVLAQGALGRGANMGKYEPGCGLGGDSLEVRAVPGGDRGREEARSLAELRVSVETDAEAIRVVLASPGVL
jgi:hypothetical protein